MELKVEKVGDVSVIKVPGRSLEASNVEEFKQDILPILNESGRVVLDIKNLDFVDSSGLGAFLSCLRTLTKAVRALPPDELQWSATIHALALFIVSVGCWLWNEQRWEWM